MNFTEGTMYVPRSSSVLTESFTNKSNTNEIHKNILSFVLYYKVYRPYLLPKWSATKINNICNDGVSRNTHVPLVVIHGGLGLPSDYLFPLADQMTSPDRCVIFHDMLGCGRSESPSSMDMYSIAYAVQDLHLLLETLKVETFHMYAHSAGVVIAYEYLRTYNHGLKDVCQRTMNDSITSIQTTSTTRKPVCLSAVFSSGSFHIGLAKKCTEGLEKRFSWLRHQRFSSETHEHDDDDDSDDESSTENYSSQITEEIRKQFICRTNVIPLPLQTAYEKVGQVWKGLDVIQDYNAATSTTPCATCQEIPCRYCIPPILLIRGEYDFIPHELSVDGWIHVLSESCSYCDAVIENVVEYVTMNGCSHMPMLEDPMNHGAILNSFYKKHDIP